MRHVSLQEKMFGCICGVHIGSSMGAQVENLKYSEIEEKYGTVDKLMSYEHYYNGWQREPGTTEDGVERQKLMISAIIDKQDRVNAEDIRKSWIDYIKPESIGMVSEPFEATLLAMAKTGIPARDLGKYCDYSGLNSFARACHPIGLINAGDEVHAKEDVLEVGQLYQTSNSRGLQWACVTGVALAAATKPDATVDSVIGSIFNFCHPDIVVKELEEKLEKTKNCKDFRELRKAFDKEYMCYGIPYASAHANEVVTKGVCIFKMVAGNTKEGIISAVNMGRDTDCTAAVAAGICGALTGAESIPKEWIKQVDYATSQNPYTNTQRTLKENCDGIYNAYLNRFKKIKQLMQMMNIE